MIRFLEYTDQQYAPGEEHEFGPAIEELYVARRVATYVTKKSKFEDREDKSIKCDESRVKRKA
jgi:hypothetical protein